MNVLLELHVGRMSAGTAATSIGPHNGAGFQQHLVQAQAAGWFCRADRLQAVRAELAMAQPAWQTGSGSAKVGAIGAVAETRGDAALGAQGLQGVGEEAAVHLPISSETPVNSNGRASGPECPTTAATAPTCIGGRTPPTPRRLCEAEAGTAPWRPVAEQERSNLRLHVEADAVGLRVWLGLDGTVSEVTARAASLASQLRAGLERGGARVTSVTCNGTPLYPCANLAREEPR